jgi:hypothetical protein
VDAIETQRDVIEHGRVESELLALHVGQIDRLWGHLVWRTDRLHWRIDGGELLSLLVAIDVLMSGRMPVCYDGRQEIRARAVMRGKLR